MAGRMYTSPVILFLSSTSVSVSNYYFCGWHFTINEDAGDSWEFMGD